MVGEQSCRNRTISGPIETCVDGAQHLRCALAAVFGHAIVGRDRASADRSPQAADGVEPVGCILVQDHHGNEAAAVSGRQKSYVDVFTTHGEPSVPSVSLEGYVGPQNVVSGNRRA